MRIMKRSLVMLGAVLMMAFLVACSSKDDAIEPTATEVTTAEQVTTEQDAEEQDATAAVEDSVIITEDEAIELVKQEVGEEYSFIPGDELEERDGGQYYVIYVKQLLETGNYTTLTTYLVKTDGSEVFDKYTVSSYFGEYARSGEVGEVTFSVFEDGTFEMTTTGDVNQVVSGVYELGVTDEASVIKLELYPTKNVIESNGETTEEDVTGAEGTAIIENDTLTLSMESEDTVFTKK